MRGPATTRPWGPAVGLGVLGLAGQAQAHPGLAPRPHDVWTEWTLEPGVLLPLVVGAGLHAVGARRLWRRSGRARGGVRRRALTFGAGLLCLVLALVSPLHRLGEALFSAHMVQHSLLLLVAAPLLVFGRPLAALLWGLPPRLRRWVAGGVRWPPVRALWRALCAPPAAWLLHALALWVWHAPVLYQATLRQEAVHAAQHLSFLLGGLLLWGAVERLARSARGAALGGLFVFTTGAQAGLLGALLTFAPLPLYPAYSGRTEPWGLSLLEDQQVGGMVMWIPGGVVYVAAALALFARCLRLQGQAEQRRPGLATGGEEHAR